MGLRGKKSQSNEEVYDRVPLETIPRFSDLRSKVDKIVDQSSWWELYGVDWAIAFAFLCLLPVSLLMLRSESWTVFCSGIFLYGWIYHSWAAKAGHIAVHGSLAKNKAWHRPISRVFVEFAGSFSEELSHDIHIKVHHPYTNIIGLGDSSTWKVPFLPRYIYMFISPLLLPPVAILVSIGGLLEKRSYFGLLKYFIVCGSGLAIQIWWLMKVCDFSSWGAIAVIWTSRAILSIPYIHVNIFQHIGLPMFSQESKPKRFYQMTTGVLNLPSNIILNYAFGHSLISCHVEHHLFPNLSDNMCLKIKPVVSKFIKESGLPYIEKTYMNRLALFLDQYDKLMVNAPPITHFVGIQ